MTEDPVPVIDGNPNVGVCFHYGSVLEARRLHPMPTLTLKNVPERLHKRLKESAALHRRSLNNEAISCLEMVLLPQRVDPRAFLDGVREMRERMPNLYIDEELLRAAKNWGRP